MKEMLINMLFALSMIFCYQPHTHAKTHVVKTTPTETTGSFAPMLERVMPAVVNVTVQGDISHEQLMGNKPSRNGNGKGQSAPSHSSPFRFQGLGSGVIIDTKNGFVVTNAHVVKDSKTIDVTLHDSRRVKAKLIGLDPDTDIAILKVDAENLHTLPIANSDKLRVGDFVVAIGNPFGLSPLGTNQTATFGIVSATKRNDLKLDGGVENFIQTDAAINPGNSGGPLVNTNGELVGINTAIVSPYGGNVGIGLAIPSNMMMSIAKQLIQYGSVKRGLMGIFVQQLTPELADALGERGQQGALITQVNPNSPADRAGLLVGDVILSVNNNAITEAAQVKSYTGLLRVGSKAHMKIFRNNTTKQIDVSIEDVKSHEEAALKKDPFFYGVALTNFEQESSIFGLVKGVQVVGLADVSPARRGGLMPGDVIVSANKTKVQSLDDLKKSETQNSKQLLLHVLRGPGAMFVVINHS